MRPGRKDDRDKERLNVKGKRKIWAKIGGTEWF